MSDWYCALVREGSTDDSLRFPLEKLLVFLTGDAATVQPQPNLRESTLKKLEMLGDLADFDLVFVHRDSDDKDGVALRHQEIGEAAAELAANNIVPVVPITMTEAWALVHLLDDEDFAQVLRSDHAVSRARRVEDLRDPKRILKDVCAQLGRDPSPTIALALSELTVDDGARITETKAWGELLEALNARIASVRPGRHP